MGYTNYWECGRDFTTEEWNALCNATRDIIKAAKAEGIEIVREYDDHKPAEIRKDTGIPLAYGHYIRFNGKNGDGHETFVLDKTATSFNFCKTARKPYDAVCVAVLMVARDLNDSFDLRSDGLDEPGFGKEAGRLIELAAAA